jgi:hypothetical protein
MEQIHGSNALTEDLLKKLAAACGPCITIVLPTNPQSDLRTQLKDAVRQVADTLKGNGHEELLAPLMDEPDPVPVTQRPTGSLIIVRSPEIFVRFFTPIQLRQTIAVEDYFLLQPLVPVIGAGREFYLLALSQKRTRLLLCTSSTSVEVPLPAGTPTNLDDALLNRQPDHVLDNRSSAGPSVGAMKGVLFGTSTDRDNKSEELLVFFHALNKGVHTLLHDVNVPLVPVAVDHELALYRRVNTYPHLVEPGVHGSPDGMKGDEMHRRALAVLRSYVPEPIRKKVEEFDKLVGTGHASTQVEEITKAAYAGRISHLFLRDNGDQPELNDAVIQTLLHGGHVGVLPQEKMPGGAPACALFRYAAPAAQTTASS